ncbi:unnamed protein product [Bursaphelenchus okinawaensis]|uniref:glucuronosyltransferase n=1 Tax=Bursaphelenchus okinawaensis TaxID=465554 RepID=A0A811LG65_9BILA|nr:unnamed protein product [Bursaphelenchus okinawaensis]CAG9121854.1 unnamed protein product [Bursaphelenchus okinawaensis]
MRVLLCLVLTYCFINVNALKVLVYNPYIGASHPLLIGKLADQLALAGHDVTILQQLMMPAKHPGHTNETIKFIQIPYDNDYIANRDSTKNCWGKSKHGFFDTLKLYKKMIEVFAHYCSTQLNNQTLISHLKSQNFDLGVAENVECCGFKLFNDIGLNRTIQVAGTSLALEFSANLGIPSMHSFVPDVFSGEIKTFGHRLKNLLYTLGVKFMFMGLFDESYGKATDDKDLYDYMYRAAYVLVNSDEFIDFPRPISHKYINIGGYGMSNLLKQSSELPEKFQKIYSNANKGVVYMSFGSVAESQSMPAELKITFLEAFKQLPEVEFLWKYENKHDKVAENYSNVHTFTWMPQREILKNSKTLAFITHGGMNSLTEATFTATPMISIPLFSDQKRNSAMIERKKMGITLDKITLTTEILVDALRKIIYDDQSYQTNAKEISELIRNRPESPDDRLLKAVEFAGRFDIHEHLDLPGRKLTLIQFYNIDVLATLAASVLVLALVILLVLALAVKVVLKIVRSFLYKEKVE